MAKNWMKKGIVALIMIAIFLAPISVGLKINNKGNLTLGIEKNKAEALNVFDCFKKSTLSINEASTNSNSTVIQGELLVDDTEYKECGQDDGQGGGYLFAYTKLARVDGVYKIYFVIKDNKGEELGRKLFPAIPLAINTKAPSNKFALDTKLISNNQKPLLLKPENSYFVSLEILGTYNNSEVIKTVNFFTKKFDSKDSTENYTASSTNSSSGNAKLNLGCSIFSMDGIVGCIAGIFYLVFDIASSIAELAGKFLDFFVYYSTNSDSYTNGFVEKGWAAIRDVANIFFIIALIYVAIKTILGLNVTNNKKLVGTVIIIALIINFSLFTTKVVIDATNILAKVFYNNITSVDEKGNIATGGGGEKSISVGIVQKFDPQKLVTQDFYNKNQGFFIFILFLLILILGYTAYIFFSVALLFVGRVIALWIYMIFSPIAFASYTLPFEIPGFGHREWWKNLLDNAFLAPVFIFFLYIIIMFAEFFSEMIKFKENADSMTKIMGVIIPFAILYMLLQKAKELAVQYSGEIGQAVTSLGGKVAGLAVGGAAGLAIGGVAALGQGTLGHGGKALFENKTLAEWETKGNWAQRKIGSRLRTIGGGQDGKGGLAGSSFDARKGVVGGTLGLLSKTTGLNLGAQSKLLMKEAGGYEADLARRNDKRKKRAEGLKIKEGEPEKQDLNKYQEEHKELSMKNQNKIHKLDLDIAGAKGRRETAEGIAKANSDNKESAAYKKAIVDQQKAADEVKKFETEKKNIKNGLEKDKDGNYLTDNGLESIAKHRNSVNEAKSEAEAADSAVEEAKEAIKTIEEEIKTVKVDVAKVKIAANKKIKDAESLEQSLGSSLAPEDIAKREAARNMAIKAKEEIDNAEKAITDAQTKLASAKINEANTKEMAAKAAEKKEAEENKFKTLLREDEEDRKKGGKGKIGYSQNYYEDELIPHQEHKVAEVSRIRAVDYANNIENQFAMPWNKAARKKSAHEIRMGIKSENHGGKGKGHGGGFVQHLAETALVHKVVGGGGHGGGDKHGGDAHGGDAHGGDAHGGDAHGGDKH